MGQREEAKLEVQRPGNVTYRHIWTHHTCMMMIMMMTMCTYINCVCVYVVYTIKELCFIFFLCFIYYCCFYVTYYIYIPILCTKLNSYKEDQFTLIIFMYQYFIFKQDKQKRQHNVSYKHNHTFNKKKKQTK